MMYQAIFIDLDSNPFSSERVLRLPSRRFAIWHLSENARLRGIDDIEMDTRLYLPFLECDHAAARSRLAFSLAISNVK
jgi:hypothetical protein